jgi:hypothetical protein
MNYKKTLSESEWIYIILGVSLFFGMIIRFFPEFQVGFPLNDGGMFLSMIQDLRFSHYLLPVSTTYNDFNIPYAYPPFGFYVARLLSDLFGITETSILSWLPPVVNTVSIFAFYKLGCAILASRRLGVLAALFYALTPGASAWFIMGGGLTRSFGSLFMLLSLLWIFQLFHNGGRRELLFSILFCVLAVLSHPEVAIHTAAGCFLLWAFYGRNLRSTLHALAVGMATLALSAPWWGIVLSYHGLTPFLSAINTGSLGVPFWRAFIETLIDSQAIIPVIPFFRVIGFLWGIWKRKYFLVSWAVLPFLVEPRSAPSIAFYPFCMLMGLAFAEALPAFVDYFSRKEIKIELHRRTWWSNTLLLIMVYLFVESGLFGYRLINTSLLPTDRDAMSWIQKNTPQQSHFLSITGVQNPEIDPFVEWFPVLTERRNQTTVQGLEWLLGENFYVRYDDLAEVQTCETVDCIVNWSYKTGLDYQYVVVRKSSADINLIHALDDSSAYKNIYSTESIAVYLLQVP